MSHLDMPLGNYDSLWFTRKLTTRHCVYGFGSFAILSLRFFLTSAPVAEFVVEIEALLETFTAGLELQMKGSGVAAGGPLAAEGRTAASQRLSLLLCGMVVPMICM